MKSVIRQRRTVSLGWRTAMLVCCLMVLVGMAAYPAIAVAAANGPVMTQLNSQLGAPWVSISISTLLSIQAVMLVHLLLTRRIGPCFKVTWIVFFILAIALAWCAAVALLASWGLLATAAAVLLLLPALVWWYAIWRGPHIERDAPPGGPPSV